MGERARLFVALDLPAEVLDALVAWREPVLRGRRELRAVPVASLHVTLAFLGSLDVEELPALSEAVAGCASAAVADPRAVPGQLAIGAPLWLPRRRPRVLSVGVEDGDGALGRLQAQTAGVLADGGWYAPEDRPYLPHITLARVRVREREGGGAALTAIELPPLAVPATFAGTAVVLYRSHLGGRAARYEPLVRVPLH